MIWDAVHNTDIPAPTVARTVSFDAHHDVRVYDPMLGTQAIAEHRDVDQVTVAISDHPVVIVIK